MDLAYTFDGDSLTVFAYEKAYNAWYESVRIPIELETNIRIQMHFDFHGYGFNYSLT